MSKNLIYANADEFHVKSTLVYADGTPQHKLYWDSEHTKPIYSDELERLYLAGGLKVDISGENIISVGMADVIAKPTVSREEPEMVTVVTVMVPAPGKQPIVSFVNCYTTLRNAPSIPAGEVHITDDPAPIG